MFPAGIEIILGDLWSPISPSHPLFPFLSSTICYFCRWAPAWRSAGCAVGRSSKKHLLPIRANICLVVSEQGKGFPTQRDSFSCVSNTGIRSPERHLQLFHVEGRWDWAGFFWSVECWYPLVVKLQAFLGYRASVFLNKNLHIIFIWQCHSVSL